MHTLLSSATNWLADSVRFQIVINWRETTNEVFLLQYLLILQPLGKFPQAKCFLSTIVYYKTYL